MKIFLTGGTGFIGSRLAAKLAARGHQVHALVRSPDKVKQLVHPGITLFKGDLENTAALQEAMKGCEAAFHLAAIADTWSIDPAAFYKINVHGTVNVLSAALEVGIKRVVVCSTAGTLGPSGGELVHENTLRTIDFHTEYESSKFVSEEKALQFLHRGLEVIITHPTRVYGPGELTKTNSWALLTDMYLRKGRTFMLGDGNRSGNFVYVDDVVDGHLLAMEKGKSGERYILGGENATARQFFSVVREVSGRKARLIAIPLWLVMRIAKYYDWRARNFRKYPMITPPFVRRYSLDWANSSEKAARELGYRPRSLKEGIASMVEWLQRVQEKR